MLVISQIRNNFRNYVSKFFTLSEGSYHNSVIGLYSYFVFHTPHIIICIIHFDTL